MSAGYSHAPARFPWISSTMSSAWGSAASRGPSWSDTWTSATEAKAWPRSRGSTIRFSGAESTDTLGGMAQVIIQVVADEGSCVARVLGRMDECRRVAQPAVHTVAPARVAGRAVEQIGKCLAIDREFRLGDGRAVPGHQAVERHLLEMRQRCAPTRIAGAFKERRRQGDEITRQ